MPEDDIPGLDKLYTLKEVAKHCRESERTVRRRLDRGEIVETRLGRHRLVAHRDLLVFLAERRKG